ncbi:MAG: HAMP domain-containing sensor histidine kinase [Aquihabitans sp.]
MMTARPGEAGPASQGWRSLRNSVRARTAATAVIVVGVCLVIGGGVLLSMLRANLTEQVRSSARLRAGDVAAALSSGTPPKSLRVSNDEDIIQVVTADGTVVASSRDARGEPAIADLAPGQTEHVSRLPGEDEKENQGFVIVATGARFESQPVTVLVARVDDSIKSSTRLIKVLLVVGIPLLLVVVASTVWWLTGRALSPVESIRREVDEISGSELHRRVPDPRSSDEIGRLATTMNRMLDRLETAAMAQRRFAADASHELRSPVATIRQHAEVALAHPDRTTIEDLAETVLAEDIRVQRLVEDLLLLTQTEERMSHHRWLPVDLDDIVIDEASRIRSTSDLTVEMSSVSGGRVNGDRAHLHRLVRNLVDNAIRHATTRLRLSLTTIDDTVVLTVEDDGAGIPEAERGRVFERFVRLDDARGREEGGSGLGLAIVADLTAVHGGEVSIGTSALGGAAFAVRLPADLTDT